MRRLVYGLIIRLLKWQNRRLRQIVERAEATRNTDA